MSTDFGSRNPFEDSTTGGEDPFTQIRTPSAWEAVTQRNRQERRQRGEALTALALEYVSVAILASAAASLGLDNGAFSAALTAALFGGLCGGAICLALAAMGVTGAHRPLLPAYSQSAMPAPAAPRGVPVIFPVAMAGAVAGVFLFTLLGALLGASSAGAGDSTATPFRGLLGGLLGLAPVGLWWVYIRRRAGKRIRVIVALLASLLILTSLAGLMGWSAGSLHARHGYLELLDRGYHRQIRGDLDGAIADFDKAVALAPQSYLGYWRRWGALLEQHRDAEAERDLQRCMDLRPDKKGDLEREFAKAKQDRDQK